MSELNHRASPHERALAHAVAEVRNHMGQTALAAQLRKHLADAEADERSGSYPRVLYKADGTTMTVVSQHEEDEAVGQGFGRDPHPVHRGLAPPPIPDMPEALDRDAKPEMPDATAQDREPGSATPTKTRQTRQVKAQGLPDSEPDFSPHSDEDE